MVSITFDLIRYSSEGLSNTLVGIGHGTLSSVGGGRSTISEGKLLGWMTGSREVWQSSCLSGSIYHVSPWADYKKGIFEPWHYRAKLSWREEDL